METLLMGALLLAIMLLLLAGGVWIAMTLAIAVVVSAVVSLTLTPMM